MATPEELCLSNPEWIADSTLLSMPEKYYWNATTVTWKYNLKIIEHRAEAKNVARFWKANPDGEKEIRTNFIEKKYIII